MLFTILYVLLMKTASLKHRQIDLVLSLVIFSYLAVMLAFFFLFFCESSAMLGTQQLIILFIKLTPCHKTFLASSTGMHSIWQRADN